MDEGVGRMGFEGRTAAGGGILQKKWRQEARTGGGAKVVDEELEAWHLERGEDEAEGEGPWMGRDEFEEPGTW